MDIAALPEHDEARRRLDGDVFFRPPGAEVGQLCSVTTGVNPRHSRGEETDRVLQLLLPVLLGFFTCSMVSRGMGHVVIGWAYPPQAMAAGLGAAGLVFLLMLPVRWCTYVGTLGAAASRRRIGLVSLGPRVFRFEAAEKLKKEFTRVFRPGYQGTAFKFTWLDQSGRRLFRIAGGFREYDISQSSIEIPELRHDHPLYFALAAEKAWNAYQLGRGSS